MLILALDTTTRAGSIALLDDGKLMAVSTGDPLRTHAERLPGDLVNLLAAHRLQLSDVEGFAVAAGPGSFTGLRIGIATIQGLAFALGRPVVGVSVLDALAVVAARAEGGCQPGSLVGGFMDAQRHEVFAALFKVEQAARDDLSPSVPLLAPLDGPVSEPPAVVLARWVELSNKAAVRLAGDGTTRYGDLVGERFGSRARAVEPLPPLAPAIAEMASHALRRGEGGSPHAVRPVYVRRPDAELARDRKSGN